MEPEKKEENQHQPISALAYQRIIIGLLSFLRRKSEDSYNEMEALEDKKIKDLKAIGFSFGKDHAYKDAMYKLLSELEAAQAEADQAEELFRTLKDE